MHRFLFIFSIFFSNILFAQMLELRDKIINSAYSENRSYDALKHICDYSGGRLTGSPQNIKAMVIWQKEIDALGLQLKFEKFKMPGWIRGDDKIEVIAPFKHPLKAIALGYVQTKPKFQSSVIYMEYGQEETFKKHDVKDKIVLVTSERPSNGKVPMRFEILRLAEKYKAGAVLFINTKKGGLNLAGTSSFSGTPSQIPAYSLIYEEGKWLQRLLQKGAPVVLEIDTRSYCKEIETANMVLRFPGKVQQKIVLGAHFDSWDLSQGAIDNGIGSAILYDVARIIHTLHLQNYFTIEIVWFNGEELGLFGSKEYLHHHKDDSIAMMINLDMTGKPTGINVMGFDSLIPRLELFIQKLDTFDLKRGIINQPWTNSDHIPFMLAGIPSITFTAHLDTEQSRYYHSIGDSFDKVNKEYLSEAAAFTSIFVVELANNPHLSGMKLSVEETKKMLRAFKLEERLKRQGEWPFRQ